MAGQLQRTGLRHQPAHHPDLGHHLGDRVLAGHRVIEHRRVQGPPLPATEYPSGPDHLAHRLEDALGAL